MSGNPVEPKPVYEPAPCPQCGATTEEEAERICCPTQDMSGEYDCPGEFQNGISVQVTEASVAALGAYYDAMGRADDEAERASAVQVNEGSK